MMQCVGWKLGFLDGSVLWSWAGAGAPVWDTDSPRHDVTGEAWFMWWQGRCRPRAMGLKWRGECVPCRWSQLLAAVRTHSAMAASAPTGPPSALQ